MKYVRYQHLANPARKGETTLANWEAKAKSTNLLYFWKKVEEFEKKDFVPREAKEIIEDQEIKFKTKKTTNDD
jgi:hypothetical protein